MDDKELSLDAMRANHEHYHNLLMKKYEELDILAAQRSYWEFLISAKLENENELN